MTNEWQDIPEDDGITLGPEEALAREIARSKALKVERLRLKDQVEKLTAQNRALVEENEALKRKHRDSSENREPSDDRTPHSASLRRENSCLPGRWAFILLVFNLAAIGILLLFLLQKSGS
ncbi:MAG: hypothetical protein OEZ51_01670 [Nitrospinota bacterium]|nr:hypothetical protein [Nitrospinota bacterium]